MGGARMADGRVNGGYLAVQHLSNVGRKWHGLCITR